MSLPSLSIDIIFSILVLLPARVLIKFLSACKSWCTIIKSQDFIKEHLKISVATGKNYILYVPVHSKPEKTFTLLNHKNFQYESELRVPFDLLGMLNCTVVSSANGLICLTNNKCFGHTIYLTNPSINKYLTLPPSSIYRDEFDLQNIQLSLGFGYDEKTNDFKVLRIGFIQHDDYPWLSEDDDDEYPSTTPGRNHFEPWAEVFSLNTNVWKMLKLGPNFSYEVHDMFSGVVVNGCLHLKVVNTYEDEIVLLSFHMVEETFQEIKYPKFHDEAGIHDLTECTCISEFKGKLGLLAFCPMFDNVGRQPCHFWIMEEYGDKNSWTCHATFMLERIIHTPLTFTKNGEIIMQDRRGKIFCYNFNNNQLIDLHKQGEGRYLNFVNFTDSLVLVDLYDTPMVEERNFPASGVGDFDAHMHVEQVNMAHKDDPSGYIPKNI